MDIAIPVALVLTAGAVWMDLRHAKIENGWTAFWLTLYLILRCLSSGPGWWRSALTGFFLPFLLLFPLFLFRMMGAGDIKLLMALGAVLGPKATLHCLFATFLIGAALSAALLFSTGMFMPRIRYFFTYCITVFRTRQRIPYLRPGVRMESIHMTIPIFAAVLLWAGGVFG